MQQRLSPFEGRLYDQRNLELQQQFYGTRIMADGLRIGCFAIPLYADEFCQNLPVPWVRAVALTDAPSIPA
jgi:hypothetical protein